METPNLDRLVREGVSFTDCFVTAPSCVPARASLFSGYYPHNDGRRLEWRCMAARLGRSARRRRGLLRQRWQDDTLPLDAPAGFHERYVVENKDRYLGERFYFDERDKGLRARGLVKQQREQYRQRPDYRERLGAFEWELPPETQSDTFVGEMAAWWLRTKPRPDGPLFLQVGFPGPHPPDDPVPTYAAPYLARDLPLQAVGAGDLAGQPPPLLAMRQHNAEVDHDSVVHLLDPTPEQRHRQRAYYLANVTMIDEQVGQLLAALEDQGYLDNTVVIFTSDHGDALGDHGHSQKWTMYDCVTRVPMIVWAPGRFAGDCRLDGLCQPDGCRPHHPRPGRRACAGVVRSGLAAARAARRRLDRPPVVFSEQGRDGTLRETAFMTMVRTPDWKLVHFLAEPFGQLFDLAADPAEVHNLWDYPASAGHKRALLDTLREWRIRSQYQTRDWGRDWR